MTLSRSLINDPMTKLYNILRFGLLVLLLGFAPPARANGTQLVAKESVEMAIRRHTLQYGPWKADNLELRLLPFQPVALPAGAVSYRVLQPTVFGAGGVQNFFIAADIAGKEEAKFWVKAEIRVFAQVIVAAVPLARQELINAKDLRLERREIIARASRPFTGVDDVVGKQPTRNIEANEIITHNSLERPIAMKRGSPVTLLFDSGSLHVETAGVAEEVGKIGDLIQVKNPSSGKVLRGVVLDSRNVRLN
jgi:flagella basal body P-ring formation protein FlgA